MMTNNLRQAEQFLSFAGSDCGVANANTDISGAEIGGALGVEKNPAVVANRAVMP